MNGGTLSVRAAAWEAHGPALVDGGGEVGWNELVERVDRTRDALRRRLDLGGRS